VRQGSLECVALCEQAQHYRELAMQCTQAITGMPGSGDKTGKQERFVTALVDVQKELQERLHTLIENKTKAEELIDTLQDPQERAVMRMYYLSGLSMEEIAEHAGKERTWPYRLKKEALKKLGD